MNISSVVLHALPDFHPGLLKSLEAVPGLEIHGTSPEGKVVLTLEGQDINQVSETYQKLHDFEGVLSVSLVYQYSDDEPDTDSEEAEK